MTKSNALPSFTVDEKRYAEVVVSVVSPIIPGLASALAPRTEVLLHDLTRFPKSIVAISQPITGRTIGGPPTDLGLRTLSNNPTEDLIGYRTELESGLVMRSSSLFFHAPSGRTVVALCMNTDTTEIQRAQELLSALSSTVPLAAETAEPLRETFPTSVEMLTQGILRDAIAATGVSIELMKKSHKLDVVRELDERGFFTLRESVDLAAKSLDVSRYTIYNYLNELQNGSDEPDAESEPSAARV